MRAGSEWLLYVTVGVLALSVGLWVHSGGDEGTDPGMSVGEGRSPVREDRGPVRAKPPRQASMDKAGQAPALREEEEKEPQASPEVQIGVEPSARVRHAGNASGRRAGQRTTGRSPLTADEEGRTAVARSEEAKAGPERPAIRTRGDLERAFQAFLKEQGLPAELPPVEAAQPPETVRVEEEETEEDPQDERALDSLMDRYPVRDARVTGSGEVWVQLDAGDAAQMPVDEIMREAAGLYGNPAAPVKVVLWSGSRAYAVRTFFGDPIF